MEATLMKAIGKFPMRFSDTGCTLSMPLKSKIVSVQMQGGIITIWAEVFPSQTTLEFREFYVVGTGWVEIIDGDNYIGTVEQGDSVWHVYESV